MKKIFTLLLLSVTAIFASCSDKYDDSELRGRIEKLETWQQSVNSSISSLQSLVAALENKDFVTGITPLADGTGYTINFSKSDPVTIKHGEKGATPIIGTKQFTDGKYYWTVNGEWLLNGNAKVPVTGDPGAPGAPGDPGKDAVAPQVRINSASGEWEISIDGGKSWTSTGVKAQGDAIFAKDGIDDSDPDYVVLTLADGVTTIRLPRYKTFKIGTDTGNDALSVFYSGDKKIELSLPAGFCEADYTAIMAEVKSAAGTGFDMQTRTGEAAPWSVRIQKPTFTNGVYNNDASVTVTPGSDAMAMLEVTIVSATGSKMVATRAIKTSPVPNEAVNVSANGNSNCYIVTPGDMIVFNAGHKGNSKTEALAGEASAAQLVWQDTQGLIKELYYIASTKQIVVTTEAKAGNAVVAVVTQEGEILWSWHLWVADYKPETALFTTPANASGTTWTFMDRNLGALNNTPNSFDSHGMIYQWGRKDPFTSAGTFTIMNMDEDYSYEIDGERPLYDINNQELPATRTLKEFHGTIEKSIRNPRVYYAMTYKYTGELDEYGKEIVVNDYLTRDWVDVSNDDYWGGVSGKKTIYDPCPAGYKVPTCDADGNTPYAWLVFANMVWDSTNHGATQNGMWFPATGTRAYASGGLDHSETNPYSGIWIGTAGKASSTPEIYPELYGQYMFIINSKRMFKVSKDARSQGMSLRCVKE